MRCLVATVLEKEIERYINLECYAGGNEGKGAKDGFCGSTYVMLVLIVGREKSMAW